MGRWNRRHERSSAEVATCSEEVCHPAGKESAKEIDLEEELELVRAVWPDETELSIERTPDGLARLALDLAPLTAGSDEAQFVRCKLLVEVPQGYRRGAAALQSSLGSTRGLGEQQAGALLTALAAKAESLVGQAAIYVLLEFAQEALTALNAPSGDCPVCLRELGEGDVQMVLRTPCFHAFHVECLGSCWWQVWEAALQEKPKPAVNISDVTALCPECRSPLSWDSLCEPLREYLEQRKAGSVYAAVGMATAAPEESEAAEREEEEQVAEGDGEEEENAEHWPSRAVATAHKQNGGPADALAQAEAAESQELLFEVVHHCGTCYRTRPRWNAKVADGQVPKGATGVVAEIVEGDVTYIRPEGCVYLLPVKGLSASVKLIHLEPRAKLTTVASKSAEVEKTSKGKASKKAAKK